MSDFNTRRSGVTDKKLADIDKKRRSKARKPFIIAIAILGVLALLVGGVYLYLDNMLGLINYTDSGDVGEYVSIDTFSFEEIGIYTSDFVETESGPVTIETSDESREETSTPSGENSQNPNLTPMEYEDYKPNPEILEGIFGGVPSGYKAEVTNILLLGCDTTGKKGSRSDTMIIMSINNVKKRVVLTSVLRDCYVYVPGAQKNNRINTAYAGGGGDLAMKTVEANFGIDIDYYVAVSFSAFKSAVDALGGANITVNDINYDWFAKYMYDRLGGLSREQVIANKTVVHLDGHETLSYARNRSYKNGDFTRTLHQRDLLIQMLNTMKSSSLSEVHNMLSVVLPYVTTDMPQNVLKAHVWNVLDYLEYKIVSNRIPAPDTFKFENIRKMSVITLDVERNAALLKSVIYD